MTIITKLPYLGNAYLCDTYAPIPVSDNLSYGFAIMRNKTQCCKCFELQWRSGSAAAGKKMQVQILNIGVRAPQGIPEKRKEGEKALTSSDLQQTG